MKIGSNPFSLDPGTKLHTRIVISEEAALSAPFDFLAFL